MQLFSLLLILQEEEVPFQNLLYFPEQVWLPQQVHNMKMIKVYR